MSDPTYTKLGGAVALLEHAIKISGLSNRAFAVDVLGRDERTVRRWLARKKPIPTVVVTMLEGYVARHAVSAAQSPSPEPHA